jgi:hypothetical protein
VRVVQASFSQAPPRATDEARQLVVRAIEAKGGLERLRAVKALMAVTSTRATTPTGEMTAEVTTYLEYPDKVHVVTRLPETVLVQVFDGRRAWVRDPAGTHDVPERAVNDLRATLQRDTMAALLAAYDGRVRARRLPDARGDDGRPLHALELSGTRLDPTILYLDPETHLVVRQAYVLGGPGDPLVEERFSDYRAVDGVQIAFTATVRRGGEPMIERRILEITINPPADPARFRRPAS